MHGELVSLAASGRAIPPVETPAQDPVETPAQDASETLAQEPGFVMVLEGAAKAAATRIAAAPAAEGSGKVSVVLAPKSGDDAIVAVVRDLPGRRVVVTADRELRARVAAAGATVMGPGWLLALLHPLASRASGHPARSAGRPHFPSRPGALRRRSENRNSRKAGLARVRAISLVWKIL